MVWMRATRTLKQPATTTPVIDAPIALFLRLVCDLFLYKRFVLGRGERAYYVIYLHVYFVVGI
jgi:hypothetical protein